MCKKLCVLFIAAFVGTSQASLLLYYDFDGSDASNDGTLGTAGTLFGGLTFVPSGADGANPLAGLAAQFNRSGLNDAAIDTTFTADQLNIGVNGSGSYTAMAWMRFDGAGGDNMIFGQDKDPTGGSPSATTGNTDQLHHGIRNDGTPTPNFHFGHWGNDIENPVGVATVGVWTHVAYTWDSTAGANIFVNGVNMGSNAGAGPLDGGSEAFNVTIGWNDRDAEGSFDGAIDEVRIYDTVLSPAEIILASQTIPEPSSFALLGLSLLGLIAYRRRRTA